MLSTLFAIERLDFVPTRYREVVLTVSKRDVLNLGAKLRNH